MNYQQFNVEELLLLNTICQNMREFAFGASFLHAKLQVPSNKHELSMQLQVSLGNVSKFISQSAPVFFLFLDTRALWTPIVKRPERSGLYLNGSESALWTI